MNCFFNLISSTLAYMVVGLCLFTYTAQAQTFPCASYNSADPPPYPETYPCMSDPVTGVFFIDPMCCDVAFDATCYQTLVTQCSDNNPNTVDNCHDSPYDFPVSLGACISRGGAPLPFCSAYNFYDSGTCGTVVNASGAANNPPAVPIPFDYFPGCPNEPGTQVTGAPTGVNWINYDACLLEILFFDGVCCSVWDVICKDLYDNAIAGAETPTVGSAHPLDYPCNDGDPLTADSCDPYIGCINTPIVGAVAPVGVALKINLEGAYSGGNMSAANNVNIPPANPFVNAPWSKANNLSGGGSVSIPATAVDWVWVEARDNANPSTVIAELAGFVLTDGSIVNADNSTTNHIDFPVGALTNATDYYFVVRMRNHLDVQSVAKVTVPNIGATYDFTTSGAATPDGTAQMKDVGGGTFVAYAGDIDGDGIISYKDYNSYFGQVGISGYQTADVDKDGDVDADDFDLWYDNNMTIGIMEIRL